MRIFISYARQDQAAVEALNADLERARVHVWMDQELTGGEAWWDTILEQIRACDLYIFALSPNSLRSRACKAELDYAIALSRPLVPVLVRDVAIQLAHPAIARTQMVDYRKRSMESLLALVAVVANRPPAPPLPDPLPTAPTTPMSYMNEFRELVEAPDLNYQQQSHLLLDLKGYLDRDEERDIALQLLRGLRQRRDISYSIAREIDQLRRSRMRTINSPTGSSAGAPVRYRPCRSRAHRAEVSTGSRQPGSTVRRSQSSQTHRRRRRRRRLSRRPVWTIENRDPSPGRSQGRLASPTASRSLRRRRPRLKRPTSHRLRRHWLASCGARSHQHRLNRRRAGVRQPLQHRPLARRRPGAAAGGPLR